MDWVKSFYSKTGKWWGPAEVKITDRDYKRLETVKRLNGSLPQSVLELGASYGNTAAVMAEAGIDVTAVEISDRADFAKEYTKNEYKGKLKFVKDDFYKVILNQKFDVVCYWNGFGIGSDNEQKTLLKRIADEWLKADGSLIMDVQNPIVWERWNGDREDKKASPEKGYLFNVSQSIKYDPIEKRMYDTWWETENPENKFVQTIRCYIPSELNILVKDTGLVIVRMEVDGKPLDWHESIPPGHPYYDHHEYLVQLKINQNGQ